MRHTTLQNRVAHKCEDMKVNAIVDAPVWPWGLGRPDQQLLFHHQAQEMPQLH